MCEYEYVGCFFDYDELTKAVKQLRQFPLECEKLSPHVTFEYKPSYVDTSLFGTVVFVKIIGYGNDGENEGVLVTLTCDNEELNRTIKKIKKPHITLSVSKKGKAVNTKLLDFKSVEPIYISGYYGGHIDN